MKISVILLMAGKGQRMKQSINKVLLEVNGKMIFEYPLELFLKANYEIVCVCSLEDFNIVSKYLESKNVKLVIGGTTRQESVYNGLLKATGDYVLIHDSARAFLDFDTLKSIEENINIDEAICTYIPVKDTIKISIDNTVKTLDRSKLLSAVTPQCASRNNLLLAHQKAKEDNYLGTDDVSLIEKYLPDVKINYLLSNEENFKITTPLDLKLARIIGESRND